MRCVRHGRTCSEPPQIVNCPTNSSRYYVRQLLGKGGFAKVFKVAHIPSHIKDESQLNSINTSNNFALKVISKCRLGDSPSGRETLRSEVSIHRQLDHTSIVHLITYWEDQYRIFLLMYLVDGPSLENYVRSRGRLTEAEAALYAFQMFEAIAYLHLNRIVHRDIKLANILLSNDYTNAQLCDFGLAVHLETLRKGQVPAVCGTPNYVAPELVTQSLLARASPRKLLHQSKNQSNKPIINKNVKYTTSADVWSMGVVMYTMMIGTGPFDSDDVNRTFRRIRTARFTFPIGIRLSSNAKSLIRALLSEDLTKRPCAVKALSHPFFVSKDASRSLIHRISSPDRLGENHALSGKLTSGAEENLLQRDYPEDRIDITREVARTGRQRRASVLQERTAFDARRWSGSHHSTKPEIDVGYGNQGPQRKDRVESVNRMGQAGANRSENRLQRAGRDRVASLNAGVPGSSKYERRSSFNASNGVDSYMIKERRNVTSSSRRFSVLSDEKRTDLLNLSVTLSAALLRGRNYLDEDGMNGSKVKKRERFNNVASQVNSTGNLLPLVRRWLDYTSKYGFATLMEDGRIGCCFNDGSIMFYVSEMSDLPNVGYIPPPAIETFTNNDIDQNKDNNDHVTADISKKACLCALFADMIMEGGRGSMHELPSACNVSFLKPDMDVNTQIPNKTGGDDFKDHVHVRAWVRLRNFRAAAFRLSNHTIHVKFDVGADICDDFVFNPADGRLFYRDAKSGTAWTCAVRNLGEFSSHSEYLHSQLQICSQAISRFLE